MTAQLAALPAVVWSAYAVASVWAERHGQPAPVPPAPLQVQMMAALALPLAAVVSAWPLRRKLLLLIPAMYACVVVCVAVAMVATAVVLRFR